MAMKSRDIKTYLTLTKLLKIATKFANKNKIQ